MMAELRKCPFCGEEAKLAHKGISLGEAAYVVCLCCFVKTNYFVSSTKYASDKKAIEAWNRRWDDEGEIDDGRVR